MIKTVERSWWTPPSLRDPKRLILGGEEKVEGVSYIRLERWSRRRRAFVLEALIRPGSPILKVFRQGGTEPYGHKWMGRR